MYCQFLILKITNQRDIKFHFTTFFSKDFYLFIHERQRERGRDTQAEGEAGSMQGARCGTRSQVPRIRPWAEGGAKPLSHPGCPKFLAWQVKTF